MTSLSRPRLLFLRFTARVLPAFIRLQLQQQVDCLSQSFEVVVVNDGHVDYRALCDRHRPDLVLFESGVYVGPRDVANLYAYPEIPKLGFVHADAFCPTRKIAIDDMARWGITTYFTTSASLGAYTPNIASSLFVWPNFVDECQFRDYGVPKLVPVLFTGSQAVHYPWRSRQNTIISQHYPTLQCPHFGWGTDADKAGNRMLVGDSYARLLSTAWCAPTCGTFANDFVRKHLEIPASNTCLVTERTPVLEAAGFVDGENCIFVDDTDVLDKLGAPVSASRGSGANYRGGSYTGAGAAPNAASRSGIPVVSALHAPRARPGDSAVRAL